MIRSTRNSILTFVHASREECERALAAEIAECVARSPFAVFGWATGSTPIGLYRELASLHAAGRLSFARASCFNLDEYLDLPAGHPHSFATWMREHLFAHVDFARAHTHLPDVHAPDPEQAASRYESAIAQAGGIELQVLGIGRNGHIGFNEPGSTRDTRTRVVELAESTRVDACRTFGSLDAVPRRAITMGVSTILAARRIRVLAFGRAKAAVVHALLHDAVSAECPATFLRGHPGVELHVDAEAAG